MKHLIKIGSILFFSISLVVFNYSITVAQFGGNSNNTLQGDNGESGTIFNNGGAIDQPGSFDPGPVDPNNPDPFEPETDPGGPGGDIDDLGEIPLDSGVAFLIAIGLVAGFVQTKKNKMLLLKKAI
jgi:hypothetical protein